MAVGSSSGGGAGFTTVVAPVVAPTAPATAASSAAPKLSPSGNPVPIISPKAGHPGSTHTGIESNRNSGLVASAKGEFGTWESKPSDNVVKTVKPVALAADPKKAEDKGIKIEEPVDRRSAFDYMQPGKIMAKTEEEMAAAKNAHQEGDEKLPGGHDPGLTPEQLNNMLTGRRALLEAVHKFGRVGLDGTPYYVQLQAANKVLGLSENDMGGYSIGGGGA